jgi:hypothetical protein
MAQPIRDSINLPGGERAQFAYYFDHNALMDGVLAGKSLFALAGSGNLIRFDSESLQLTGQTIVPGRATTIALGIHGDVLVGTQDGHIYRVNRASLGLDRIASFKGRIAWLGTGKSKVDSNGRIVAVVDNSPDILPWPGEADKAYESRGRAAAIKEPNPYYVIILENGKTRSLPLPPISNFPFPGYFLLDSQNRLWLGADNGEWGGECAYMNLHSGRIHKLHSGMSGVLGFIRTADERILVYGGTSHMGMYSGYIAEIKNGDLSPLVNVEHDDWQTSSSGKLPEPIAQAIKSATHPDTMPNSPIDLVMTDQPAQGFWVVSAHTLYHADDHFNQWEKVAYLGGRWEGGRRLSVGNTPTVKRLITDPERPDRLIAIMGRDGLERVTGAKVEALQFAGQLEASVIDIWNTSLGTVLLGSDNWNGGHAPWLLKDDQWHRFSLFPDRPPSDGAEWYFAEPFGNDGSRLSAFTHNNLVPGKAFMVQLDETGAAKVIDSWNGDDSQFETTFLTASDGTMLKASEKQLYIRQQGIWKKAGISQLDFPMDRKFVMEGRKLVFLGKVSHFDYFLDAELGDIYQLMRPQESGGEYSLVHAAYKGHETPAGIFDAAPDHDGWVLLSTAHGLLQFNLESGQKKLISTPNINEEIKTLCRDNQGRLWAAGDLLYISSDEGRHWEQVKLPMLTRTYTKRIRPNPANPRQMILTLEDMGVVTIDW